MHGKKALHTILEWYNMRSILGFIQYSMPNKTIFYRWEIQQ